jgi:uncharacterized protein
MPGYIIFFWSGKILTQGLDRCGWAPRRRVRLSAWGWRLGHRAVPISAVMNPRRHTLTNHVEDRSFSDRYGRWAVIAGASEGVGASLADQLAARGLNLVLIARNGPLVNGVAAGVRERYGVQARPLVLDLTDADLGAQVAEATDGLEIGLVIYNAGAANRTVEFLEDSFEQSLKQIKLACIGPLALARHFAPAMRERGRGGIVVVGSLSCLAGSATIAVYSAVKAFNVNFAEGLWAELHPYGVDVVCTVLGKTDTEAMQRMGVAPDDMTMRPGDVASEIVANIGNGPVHVVGEANRVVASHVWTVDRRALVEMMSAASVHFATELATADR